MSLFVNYITWARVGGKKKIPPNLSVVFLTEYKKQKIINSL